MAGIDFATFPHLDPHFRPIAGNDAVAQCLLRRLTTPRGSLPQHPDDGRDIRDMLLDALDEFALARWKAEIESECLRDERVLTATVDLTFDTETREIDVSLFFTSAAGPFRLVLQVSELEVRRLQ